MTTQTTLSAAKRAYKLFSHAHAEKSTIRHNVAQYLKALETLGDKWLLSTPVQRKN